MLDSILIGMTGLSGYSKGLKVIANNTANINTPGFKGSSLQFSDMLANGGNTSQSSSGEVGHGLSTGNTVLNFDQGELRQTGNSLDLAVDGDGLFTLKDANGDIQFSRAGQFEFNTDGILINRADGDKVMALNENGSLAEISLSSLRTGAGAATSTIAFSGNLSSTATEQTVGGIKVFDQAGGEHTLSIRLTNNGAGNWSATLLDGTTTVGSGQISFTNGVPTPGNATVSLNYTPAGMSAMPLTLDFGANVTSFASGNLSSLTMATQNGYGPGALTQASFDNLGTLILTYENGQTVKGARLALGRFDSPDAAKSIGGNKFSVVDSRAWHVGTAGNGGFGAVQAGVIEISNVDLSREFSDLVVMQRGYQASSQIVSTANDMLQELFSMKGK